MNRPDEFEYYSRRINEALASADRAADGTARRVHLELAERYRVKAAQIAPVPPVVA